MSIQAIQAETTGGNLEALTTTIQQDVNYFVETGTSMLSLANDQLKNFPAIAYAGKNINPASQVLLNHLSQMIMSEMEEESTEERKEILSLLHDSRYTWANVMNGIRAYLAFRNQSAMEEIILYKASVESNFVKLMSYSENGDLTLDQEDGLEQLIELEKTFNGHLENLQAIDKGNTWRTDAYLVRSKLGPVVTRIQNNLNQLVNEKLTFSKNNSQTLISEMATAKSIISGLVIAGLLLNILILFITHCQIIKPVAHLRDILRDISQGKGDLTRRVPVNAADELGQASSYFNTLMENLQSMIREIKEVSHTVMDKSEVASEEIATVASNTHQCAGSASDAAATTEHISTSSLQIVGNVPVSTFGS